MTKQEKIKYINATFLRFVDAKNHGGHNNWWYPKANVIAYNVKLHGSSKSIEDIRTKLSKRQNEYYTDEDLYEQINDAQGWEAEQFSDSLDEDYCVTSGYSGRSGGWLEVEYTNELTELEEDTNEDVTYFYKLAKALTLKELTIAEYISKSLKHYQQYLNTDQYVTDIIEQLNDDETIGDIYKSRAKDLLDHLN